MHKLRMKGARVFWGWRWRWYRSTCPTDGWLEAIASLNLWWKPNILIYVHANLGQLGLAYDDGVVPNRPIAKRIADIESEIN